MNMHRVLKGDFRIGYYSGIGYPQNVGMHTHPYHEFSLITAGDITYCSSNCTEHITGKSIIFSAAYQLHQPYVKSDAAYENYQIMFRDELLSSFIPESRTLFSRLMSKSQIQKITDEEHDRILTIMKIMYDRYKTDPDSKSASLEFRLLVSELMLIATDIASKTAKNEDSPKFYVDDVVKYIQEHYAEDIKLDELASNFFISYAKLTRDFKKHTGMTINNYITLTRIENAKALLKQGYSINSVASLCGYSSPSYFIKTFRQYTHITPLKFQQTEIDIIE